MKTPVLNWKHLVSNLTIFGFTVLISLVLPVMPALAIEFEIGTQFGISHLVPDDDEDDFSTSLTYTRFPSGTFLDIGGSPTSLYAMLFPAEKFAIGPEFSFGRMSISEEYGGEKESESITTLHLGGRAAFFFLNHSVSSPYIFGRVSHTIFNGGESFFFNDEEALTGFGGGVGYQWRIGAAFVLRAEGQYQRLSISDADEAVNEFSFIIGLGTRFGKQ